MSSAPLPSPSVPSASPPGGRVVVVGSVNLDLSLQVPRHPRPGQTLTATGGDRSPGGKGANQALAASRAGAEVSLVGAVGTDPSGEEALALLRADGVDLSAVETVEGPTGLAVVAVDAQGENTILVLPGANAAVDAAAVARHGARIAAADVVVLQGEIDRSGTEAAARRARRLVLNPAPVSPLDPEVLRRAEPLVVNEHEAQQVLALLRPDAREVAPPSGAADDGAHGTPTELATQLRAAGVRAVVLTLGAAGAVLADADGPRTLPGIAVRAVDTTGAGDAVTGALAARLAAGDGLEDAVRWAQRFAAASVRAPGAQGSYPARGAALPGAGPGEGTALPG